MTFRRVLCLILFAFVSLAGSLSVSRAWNQTTQKTDGGDPQPLPPTLVVSLRPSQRVLVADGGDLQPLPPMLVVSLRPSRPMLIA